MCTTSLSCAEAHKVAKLEVTKKLDSSEAIWSLFVQPSNLSLSDALCHVNLDSNMPDDCYACGV